MRQFILKKNGETEPQTPQSLNSEFTFLTVMVNVFHPACLSYIPVTEGAEGHNLTGHPLPLHLAFPSVMVRSNSRLLFSAQQVACPSSVWAEPYPSQE